MTVAEVVYKKPDWFTAHVLNPLLKVVHRLGIGVAGSQTLAVRGRKSGEIRTNPVNPFELDGRTYLLSPRGMTQWVRNLRAAGGEPEHLASLTVYIVDMDDYRARAGDIGQVWKRLVGRDYPAMAGIGVARLWDAEALVEVQGFAVLP